jgi:hypothetical protein
MKLQVEYIKRRFSEVAKSQTKKILDEAALKTTKRK